MCTNKMYYFPTYVDSGGKEDATADGYSYHVYTYMIAFTCFTNNMYRFWRKGRDSHTYHAYTYMIAFPFFNRHFVIVYELLYFQ